MFKVVYAAYFVYPWENNEIMPQMQYWNIGQSWKRTE